jgi:hypothetical protein
LDSSYCLSKITIYAILLFVLSFCRSSSRASLGLCLWRSHLLRLTKTPYLPPLCHILLLIHLSLFFSSLLVLDRSKSYFINHICWLENFCVYTEISFHFLGVLQLISARFCLLIQQGSVISLKSLLHRAPGRLLGLPFSSLGNISPFLSYSYPIF